jgi:hypothetical protein
MNWGNRILLVFVVFAIGIAYLVYRATSTNFELVDAGYYKDELKYQQVIDSKNNANSLSALPKLEVSSNGLLLSFPSEMKQKKITGEVYFYCSYDSKKDKRFSLDIDSSAVQVFDIRKILPGTYVAKISWADGSKSYYAENNITIP